MIPTEAIYLTFTAKSALTAQVIARAACDTPTASKGLT